MANVEHVPNVLNEKNNWKWEDSNVPHVYEPYPEKRKKLAAAIHEIDDYIKKGQWRFWTSWKSWDFMRQPITYCFTCMYPVRLVPTIHPMTGALQRLECQQCGLIHFDIKHD